MFINDYFEISWQDGINFCALVHRAVPDKIDFNNLDVCLEEKGEKGGEKDERKKRGK